MATANVANCLPFLCSMAAANDPRTLTCRSRSLEFSNREPMVDDRVVNIIKALVERGPPVGAYGPPVRAPLALKWLWVPNKKNRPAHIFRDRYREQLASMLPGQVVPNPDSSPYTPHASPSLTIPAFTSHPSPSLTIPAFTSHPSPSFTIPVFTSHPSPSLTIPAFTSHPSPTLTIPSSTPHPSPSPTIPHPSPSPTIPPPTPHPCHGSDIRPPLPQSFPELSPIPSFDLGLHPTPPEMQQEPPSHSTSIAPSLAIDPPHI
nr:hypothetical protein CFP56_35140 [Quercus suber]